MSTEKQATTNAPVSEGWYRRKPAVVHAKRIADQFVVSTSGGMISCAPGGWLIQDLEDPPRYRPVTNELFQQLYETSGDKPK